jgi:DNA-binding CsgD family transcriptional regulator
MPILGDLLFRAVDGAFAVDAKQRIIYWDAGCEELFNRPAKKVLGRTCCAVMRGVSPVSGELFCGENCHVAQLANGGNAPKSFSIQTKADNSDEPMTLSVNVVLVPSQCKNRWIVMHLLHRGMSRDVLTAMDCALRAGRSAPAANCNGNDGEVVLRITKREHDVLQLLAEGLSCPAISKRLDINVTTVRNHVQHIQHKLGVHSQTEAVAYAYRHNLVN